MYYELYVDTLFIVNFIMNLCLLYLTDRSTGRTATRRGILAGGAAGALCFLIPFFCRGHIWLRVMPAAVAGTAAMILLTFKVRSLRAFFKVTGKLIKYTFLLGGGILFFKNILGRLVKELDNTITVMAAGIILTLIIAAGIDRKNDEHVCEAVLVRNGRSITVRALIDSGNSLVEPISGKAVSVLDKTVFDKLYGGDEAFRVVPFHSVGKAHGILKGYFLDELKVNRGGIQKSYRDVCIAVGGDEAFVSKDSKMQIELILNPEVLRE